MRLIMDDVSMCFHSSIRDRAARSPSPLQIDGRRQRWGIDGLVHRGLEVGNRRGAFFRKS